MAYVTEFSYVDDNWIPTTKGCLISLREAFQGAHSLGGTPIEKISVFNLMLTIAQVACKLDSDYDWEDLTHEQFVENCLKYLDTNKQTFRLDTFMQMKDLPDISTITDPKALANYRKPIMKFAANKMAGDNNALIRHQTVVSSFRDDAERALTIVTGMCCVKASKGYDELSTPTVVNKRRSGATGGLYLQKLHAFYFLSSISETIRYSIITNKQLEEMNLELGTPWWEKLPNCDSDPWITKNKDTFLGKLFPLSRFFVLEDSETMLCTCGIPFKSDKTDTLYSTVTNSKNINVEAKVSVVPWQQLDADLAVNDKGFQLSSQCNIVRQRIKYEDRNQNFVLWLGGLGLASKAGEFSWSEKSGYTESQLILAPTTFFCSSWPTNYRELLKMYNDDYKHLLDCTKGYFKDLHQSHPAALAESKVKQNFWYTLKRTLPKMIAYANTKDMDIMEQLKDISRKLMIETYTNACPHESGDTMIAFGKNYPIAKPKNVKTQLQGELAEKFKAIAEKIVIRASYDSSYRVSVSSGNNPDKSKVPALLNALAYAGVNVQNNREYQVWKTLTPYLIKNNHVDTKLSFPRALVSDYKDDWVRVLKQISIHGDYSRMLAVVYRALERLYSHNYHVDIVRLAIDCYYFNSKTIEHWAAEAASKQLEED